MHQVIIHVIAFLNIHEENAYNYCSNNLFHFVITTTINMFLIFSKCWHHNSLIFFANELQRSKFMHWIKIVLNCQLFRLYTLMFVTTKGSW